MIRLVRNVISDSGRHYRLFALLLSVCLTMVGSRLVWGQIELKPRVALILSQNIRPYLEAAEGINSVLKEISGAEVNLFALEKLKGKSKLTFKHRISEEEYHLIIGIGPEAAHIMEDSLADLPQPKVYSMVLLPMENIPFCGVSLNIPVQEQLEKIHLSLPFIKRLGLLYDPVNNSSLFLVASAYSEQVGIDIVPLSVSSKTEIPGILDSHLSEIDGIWLIPDQTVISETIIQYVTKEALFQKRPVIGYNRFFYESGAAVAFIFNYEELGRQTAEIALNLIHTGTCMNQPPMFHTWLNQRIYERLDIEPIQIVKPGIELGP